MNADPSRVRSFSARTRVLVGLAILVVGLVARYLLVKAVTHLHPTNWHTLGPDIFYYLTGWYEPVGLGILGLAAALFAVFQLFDSSRTGRPAAPSFSLFQTVILAAAIFAFCLWGSFHLFHRFPLSMDENAALYQAAIFRQGHIAAPVPPEWQDYLPAALPDFIQERPDHTLVTAYLPVYGTLLALADRCLGTTWLLNPLLAAGCVVAIYGIGRNLDISRAFTGWAVVLLATSTQFLITGMSAYAMTAHLFFSLAWLFFYTHPNRRFYYVCPPLGVLAMGLHNPFPHVLFVVPFLFRLLLDRRWPEAVYSFVVYLAGGIGWICWVHAMLPEHVAQAENSFVAPGMEAGFIFLLSMLLLMAWQNFLASLLFVASLARVRAMPPLFRDLLAGLVLTLIFYACYVRNQGSGWGYRYAHQVLSNLVLIAAWGATQYAVSRIGFAATTVVALAMQLPFRCAEVSQVVQPQYAFYEHLRQLDADYVIIDRSRAWIWYSAGFVRNAPDFKNRPLVFYRERLTDDQVAHLSQAGKTVIISSADFTRLGIPVVESSP